MLICLPSDVNHSRLQLSANAAIAASLPSAVEMMDLLDDVARSGYARAPCTIIVGNHVLEAVRACSPLKLGHVRKLSERILDRWFSSTPKPPSLRDIGHFGENQGIMIGFIPVIERLSILRISKHRSD